MKIKKGVASYAFPSDIHIGDSVKVDTNNT